MNRAEILAKVGRALNKSSPLDALTKARLLDVINTTHRKVISSPGCQGLRRRQFDFASVAGQDRYALYNGESITHIRDLTNNRELLQQSLTTYRLHTANPALTQGTPDTFIQYGFEPVYQQPLVGGTSHLSVVSSSAADTTQTVSVEASSYTASATLNGTTPVVFSAPIAYIDKFYLSAVANGIVSLSDDTGRLLGQLAGVTSVQWLAFYLNPVPSQVLGYEVDAEFSITDLAQDTDTPQVPADFHDLIVTGAIMDELAHLDDNRLVVMQRSYDKRLNELKLRLARMGTDRGGYGTTSRFGSWAPNTSW